MAETNRPAGQAGLTARELVEQEAQDLPDRDAMSIIGHVDLGIGVPVVVEPPVVPEVPLPVDVEAPGGVPVDVGDPIAYPLEPPLEPPVMVGPTDVEHTA